MVKERLKLTLEEVFYNLFDEYGEKFNWRLIPLTQSGRGIFIDELKKEIGKNHFYTIKESGRLQNVNRTIRFYI